MQKLTVGFIGLGLIGGSIARTMKQKYPNCYILAYNRTQSVLTQAHKDGTIDTVCDCVDERFHICDYIFLCLPVSYNADYLQKLKGIIKDGCIITDVGSVKTDIHTHVTTLNLEKNFIGGHPMTGSEKTGYEYSTAHLLENAYYIITPTASVSQTAVDNYYRLVKELGALPLILDFETHDYMTAAVSHLPHVIASTLTNQVKNSDNRQHTMQTIAAGGFRDVTRIAAGSPVMWQQICLTNAKNLRKVLSDYIESLKQFTNLLDNEDSAGLLEFFEEACEYRGSLTFSKGLPDPVFELYCDLQDEAGAIAQLSTSLAIHHISIKNIGIIHNREYEHGALHIEFYNEKELQESIALLKEQNYTIYHN